MLNSTRITYSGMIGRTADGSRVTVDICLETPQHSEVTTVTHDVITTDATMLTFSASGTVTEKGKREPSSAGQCLDVLNEITVPVAPWTLDDIASLHTIWSRWHLNSMNAACAHMDTETLVHEDHRFSPNGTRIATGAKNTCPVSGYTYGADWLYEPLPSDVLAEIKRLQGMLDTRWH